MAYPFAAAEVLTAVDLNAMIGAPTQNAITTVTYTAVLLDAGKTVTLSNASAVTLTIPAQASVSWADNTQLNFLNLGAGTVTITPAVDVTINGTPLTLATSKGGSLVRTASNTWTFVPFSGGAEAANFTNTATGTYSSGGISYKYISFLSGTSTLVIDRAGFADIVVIGGGGGGGSGGGGAGGYLASQVFLPAATHTVVIGAGGAGTPSTTGSTPGSIGLVSSFGIFEAGGGGGGGTINNNNAKPGASGGGAGRGTSPATGGAGTAQGFAGGNNVIAGPYPSGGGGGAGGLGSNGVTTASGAGGAGVTSSITGTAVGRAGGGGGGGDGSSNTAGSASSGGGAGSFSGVGTAGTVNTGGGGGAGGSAAIGGAGGSGVVIVRVAV